MHTISFDNVKKLSASEATIADLLIKHYKRQPLKLPAFKYVRKIYGPIPTIGEINTAYMAIDWKKGAKK